MEENAQLHLSTKNSLSESATLVAQLDQLKSSQQLANGSSVGSDLIGDAQARVLKLQLENQRLEAELEQVKRDSFLSSADKLLELEKENKRLSLKVGRLVQKERYYDYMCVCVCGAEETHICLFIHLFICR